MFRKARLIGAGAVFCCCAAWAQGNADTTAAPPPGDYISILGSYLIADTDRGPDVVRGTGGQLIYGQSRWPFWVGNLGWEFQAFGDVIDSGTNGLNGADLFREGFTLDLTYALGDRRAWTPFVLGGVGGDYNDVGPNGHDQFNLTAQGGFGLVSPALFKKVRFRGEARYIRDRFDSGIHQGFNDYRISLGIEIPLYQEVRVTLAPQEKVKVVTTGLEDSDGDGVVDSKDQCPNTPPGTRVDGNGCPLQKVTVLHGVTFEFNKSRLRPDAETILNEVAAILKKYPDMKVEIAGHTDNIGSDAYNQKLSERRAQAVVDYLVSQGVPAGQMTAKGYGESDPIASNDTDEGRERNRRVEMRILN